MGKFDESKSLFASKTFWGVVISLIGLLNAPGWLLETINADDLAKIADTGFEAVGLLLALIGRIKAKQPVHVLPPM